MRTVSSWPWNNMNNISLNIPHFNFHSEHEVKNYTFWCPLEWGSFWFKTKSEKAHRCGLRIQQIRSRLCLELLLSGELKGGSHYLPRFPCVLITSGNTKKRIYWQRIKINMVGNILACEYSRLSFTPTTTACETWRQTSAIHRQKFLTDDVNLPALKWYN